MGGHTVDIASEFRSFSPTPEAAAKVEDEAASDLQRLRAAWSAGDKPDLWFCYHPYYKSVDPFGPTLCAAFGVPLVTAEASYSPKRDQTEWAPYQARIGAMVRDAEVNIGFTRRDRVGLEQAIPKARIAALEPFIDTTPFEGCQPRPDPTRLITVAMMRAGDKMQSYAMLAQALATIRDRPWTLAVVGDGPMRGAVERLFAEFEPGRIDWLGERGADDIVQELGRSGIYAWPGCGEAYGLAYLEAQAAGLPVVAQRTAGVPEVVRTGLTGLLTAEGDIVAYASAIGELLEDASKRTEMARAARRFVVDERSLATAAKAIDEILRRYIGKNDDRTRHLGSIAS